MPTTEFEMKRKIFNLPPEVPAEMKSYKRTVEDNVQTVAELSVQGRKAGARLPQKENELSVLKVMLWMAKPKKIQQLEALGGVRKSQGKRKEIEQQVQKLEVDRLCEQSTEMYWQDLYDESKQGQVRSDTTDSAEGQDSKKALLAIAVPGARGWW